MRSDAFYALAWCLRGLATPLVWFGEAATWCARPILWAARRCEERAREWDPRLWARSPRRDSHPQDEA